MSTSRFIMTVLGLALALFVVYHVDPSEQTLVPCPLYALTGIKCAGCGMTRAAHELMHGEVGRAMQHNMLSIVVLPVLGLLVVRRSYAWWSGRNVPGIRLPSSIGFVAVV
ncbi:MAG: DUF2752 domain-containing protein, partial [Candidatus Kapaibacterium sp.]